MNNQLKSGLLVALQFTFLGILFLGSFSGHFQIFSFSIILLGCWLALWSVIVMKSSKLRISPIPYPEATLVTNGPYKCIRHPMYGAIIILVYGMLLIHFSWIRIIVSIGLILLLVFKLNWEEEMLLKKFEDYRQYQQSTWKIIPDLY